MELTLALVALLLAAVGFGIYEFQKRRQNLARYLSADDKAMVHVRWHEIEQRMKKAGPTNMRQAVIEADTLVDYCLKQLGTAGETMGERLRNSGDRFTDYEGLWAAHKLRNQLVHELNRDLLSSEAKRTIARFKTALSDLGAV